LNQYKSLSWRQLKTKTDKLKVVFMSLVLAQKLPKLAFMELRVFHNTRLDVDNVTGTIKVFVDVLRHCNVIADDTKNYFDYLSIQYTPQLEKNTLVFEITGEKKKK
jgi:Holliday junction resolvase RusA-like endonuclease